MKPDEIAYAIEDGAEVIARTMQGGVHDRGTAVSYSALPTLTIRRKDGTLFNWRVDLCEINPRASLIGKRVRTVVEGTLKGYDHETGAFTLITDPAQHVPWEMQFHWDTKFEPIDD